MNPSGQLSVSWPRSVGGIGSQTPYLQQAALHYGEAYQDQPSTPLFPFGYGNHVATSALGCAFYLFMCLVFIYCIWLVLRPSGSDALGCARMRCSCNDNVAW